MSRKSIQSDDLAEYLFSPPESRKQRLWRKVKANPFVPLGCGLTVAALSYGLFQFVKGDQRKSNLMMRARVAAQGFTIFVLVAGVYINMKPKVEAGK